MVELLDTICQFGGATVRSPFQPTGLPRADGISPRALAVNVAVGGAPAPGPRQLRYTWKGAVADTCLWKCDSGWSFETEPGGIHFDVEDAGHRITCRTPGGTWNAAADELLVSRVLPRLLDFHGSLVLHGATLFTGEGAVCIVGRSGSGKSTLAAALASAHGWSLMGDDAAVLDVGRDQVVAFPTGTGIDLLSDSVDALGPLAHTRSRLIMRPAKQRCGTTRTSHIRLAPLAALFVIDHDVDAGGVMVTSEPFPRSSLGAIARHFVRFDPSEPGAELRRIGALMQLVRTVRLRSLRFPHRYDALRATCDHIKAQVSESASGGKR